MARLLPSSIAERARLEELHYPERRAKRLAQKKRAYARDRLDPQKLERYRESRRRAAARRRALAPKKAASYFF